MEDGGGEGTLVGTKWRLRGWFRGGQRTHEGSHQQVILSMVWRQLQQLWQRQGLHSQQQRNQRSGDGSKKSSKRRKNIGLTAATITETTGSAALAKGSAATTTVSTTDPMGVSIFLPFLESTTCRNTVAAGALTEAALVARAVYRSKILYRNNMNTLNSKHGRKSNTSSRSSTKATIETVISAGAPAVR